MNNDEYRAVANLAAAYINAFYDRAPAVMRRCFTDLAACIREINDGPNTVADAAREVLRVRGSSNFAEINRALDALDAALGEADDR